MKKRLITKTSKIKFKPFDNYGNVFIGMDWHKITYDKKTGQGSYILKLKDNTKFNKGDFVSFKPGSHHSSYTKKGCTLLVFMRRKNKLL